MAKTNSTDRLTEKLARLFADRPRNELADALGVHRQSIHQYLGGAVPGPTILLKIARHFKVPIEWLVDEEQGTTPPGPAENLSDYDLMMEVCRRHRLAALKASSVLDSAEEADWWDIAEALFTAGVDRDAGRKAFRGLELATSPETLMLDLGLVYNPVNFAAHHHDELPGKSRDPVDLEPEVIRKRAVDLLRTHPEIRWGIVFANLRAQNEHFPDRRDAIVAKMSDMLAKVKARQLPEASDFDLYRGPAR